MKKKLQVLFVLASLFLSACGSGEPETIVVVVTATPESEETPKPPAEELPATENTPIAAEAPTTFTFTEYGESGGKIVSELGTVTWTHDESMVSCMCKENAFFSDYDEVYLVYPGLYTNFPNGEIPHETMATWCGNGNADDGFTWIAPLLDFIAIFSEDHKIPDEEFWKYEVDIISVNGVETVTMDSLVESDPQVPLTIGVNWTK